MTMYDQISELPPEHIAVLLTCGVTLLFLSLLYVLTYVRIFFHNWNIKQTSKRTIKLSSIKFEIHYETRERIRMYVRTFNI